MRISSGQFKGRRLKTPKGDTTRPTSEKLRQAFFNMCQHTIEDAIFLDVFAGSGAMGLEAISRGATSATFLEQDKKATACLKENIETLELQDKTKLVRGDALKTLHHLSGTYTHIYIDPPYGKGLGAKALLILDKADYVNEETVIYLEEAHHTDHELKRLKLIEKRPFQERFLYIYKSN